MLQLKQAFMHSLNLKNYYQNLSDFQKQVLKDVVYSLQGYYDAEYIFIKYEKEPLFERKTLLFSGSTPNYLALFIYHKSYIPSELLQKLKSFLPKPSTWNPLPISHQATKKVQQHHLFYTLLFLQFGEIQINKRQFTLTDDSFNQFKSIFPVPQLLTILKHLQQAGFLKQKGKKQLLNHQKFNSKLQFSQLNLVFYAIIQNKDYLTQQYPEFSTEEILGIIQFRKLILKTLDSLPAHRFFKETDLQKAIKINAYKQEQRIHLSSEKKQKDFKRFMETLSALEIIDQIKETQTTMDLVKLNTAQKNYIHTKVAQLSLPKQFILLNNFEIITLKSIKKKTKFFLSLFTTKKNHTTYQINKTLLLKHLNQNLSLSFFKETLNTFSQNGIPELLNQYFEQLRSNQVSIKTQELQAHSLLIDSIVYHKKFKDQVEKQDKTSLIFNEKIEKKLRHYLTTEGYLISIR